MSVVNFGISNSLESSTLSETSVRPTFSQNFVNSNVLDPRITFTRASSATRVNKFGLIETAVNDTPRFDYDPATLACKGLLIEEQRTNAILSSMDLRTVASGNAVSAWTSVTTTQTLASGISPDGTNTATKIAASGGNVSHTIASITQTVTAGTFTLSVYLKAAEFTTATLGHVTVGGFCLCNYTLTGAGAASSVNNNTDWSGGIASIQNVGNGWYRCVLTATTVGTAASMRIYPGTSAIYDTDGSGILAWGAQYEAGAFQTSYIQTTTAAATRTFERAVVSGTNFSSWFNPAKGSFIAEWRTGRDIISANVFMISDSTTNEQIRFRYNSVGNIDFAILDGAVAVVALYQATTLFQALDTVHIMAASYSATKASTAGNGSGILTDATVSLPTVSSLHLGCLYVSSEELNGHLRSFKYFSAVLTDDQLVTSVS